MWVKPLATGMIAVPGDGAGLRSSDKQQETRHEPTHERDCSRD
jgi:hypothetical protein